MYVVTLPAGDWVSSDKDISTLLSRKVSGGVRTKGRKSRFLNQLLMAVPHLRRPGLGLAILGFTLGAVAGSWLGM